MLNSNRYFFYLLAFLWLYSSACISNEILAEQNILNAQFPIKIKELQPLSFGKLVASAHSNTQINMTDSSGKYQVHNGKVFSRSAIGPAQFLITGKPNSKVRVSLPSRVVMKSDKGIAYLDNFEVHPFNNTVLGPTGSLTINIIADLTIPASSSGDFDTTFRISADYE